MVAVDPTEQLKQAAVGGPTAAAEYASQQKGISDIKQQALSNAAASSDALQAPAAFRAAQQQRLSVPLDAQAAQLAANGAAASQFSGAQAAGQAQYMGGVQSVYGPDGAGALTAERKMMGPGGYMQEAHAYARRMANQKRIDDQAAKVDTVKQSKDWIANRKEQTRQDAAADTNIHDNSYKVIEDVIKHADDGVSATRYFHLNYHVKNGKLYDSDENVLKGSDAAAIDNYITQAFSPDTIGRAATDDDVLPPELLANSLVDSPETRTY